MILTSLQSNNLEVKVNGLIDRARISVLFKNTVKIRQMFIHKLSNVATSTRPSVWS